MRDNNKMVTASKDSEDISIELVHRPIIKSYVEETPEAPDEVKRKAFFKHRRQFFVITAAGKPIFTRYALKYKEAELL